MYLKRKYWVMTDKILWAYSKRCLIWERLYSKSAIFTA